ncbi:hypothetical protein TorRG33x02_039580, partial [Trema orientale]
IKPKIYNPLGTKFRILIPQRQLYRNSKASFSFWHLQLMMILGAAPLVGAAAMVVIFTFFIAVVLVKGLLLVKDAALFGTLLLHKLVVHSPLFPRYLLLLPVKPHR